LKFIESNNEITKKVNGFYNLEADKVAIAEYLAYVEENTEKFGSVTGRIKNLIDNDFYYDVYEEYSEKEVKEVTSLVRSVPFEFQSFMAVSKYFEDYSLKSNDKKKYLETYQDRIVITSLFLGAGDSNKAKDFATAMIEQRYQPATPTFLNSGKKRRGELVSCFLIEMDDSLNSILFNVGVAGQLSKIGGGVAINLSKLRARTEAILDIENAASGIMPVLKLLEDIFSYVNQLGQRKGAGAAYLNIFHADRLEFLDTKKINADEKSRLQSLSIGLTVPHKFMELAEKNEFGYAFYPYTVYKEYGVHLDDMNMSEMYDELVANPRVKKKKDISARDLLTQIAITQIESGYPYLIYIDTANRRHALKKLGKIKMSNLCTEIFQLQETSLITDYGKDDVIYRDISCNLGSINIVNAMERKNIRGTVHTGMRALTVVSKKSDVANAPSIAKANRELHSVGLGYMNLHGYLAKNKIHYGSPEAIEFLTVWAAMVNYYSIEASMHISLEEEETFLGFEESDYYSGEYFDQYLTNDYSPKMERVKELFDGIYIPTKSDWEWLKLSVRENGLYHAYRLAIAPTQSISYVQNSTQSIMPITKVIEDRGYGNSTTYYPMPYLSPETEEYYVSAYEISQYKVIDMVAAAQDHIDQGISCTLHVYDDTPTNELARLFVYAWKKGLKSLYYVRPRDRQNLDAIIEEEFCETCTI
jgi:ribonucleoside-diphosphate reductase alpha chain